MLTRRNFVSLVSALPVMLGSISVSTAQPNSATTPGENLLEGGDFVFPRKRDDYIPYFAREAQQLRSYTEDEAEWNATKKEFLAQQKKNSRIFQIRTLRLFGSFHLPNFIPHMSARSYRESHRFCNMALVCTLATLESSKSTRTESGSSKR